MNKTLIIIDAINVNYISDDAVYTWTGYIETEFQKSLLEYVDKSGEYLKSSYLEFIHDIGEFEYKNSTIREYFQQKNGVSLWWMSLLVEKSPYKSERIKDCLKLLAIEKLISDNSYQKVTLVLDNKLVAKVIKDLCNKMNIHFEWEKPKRNWFKMNRVNENISIIYNITRGFVYLIYYFFSRWNFTKNKSDVKMLSNDSVFFSSYFFNLNLKKLKTGDYYSRQWADLPKYFNNLGQATTHLENYVQSPEIPNVRTATKLLKEFNKKDNLDNHLFVDKNLSIKLFFKVLNNFFKLIYLHINFRDICLAFNVGKTNLNLWLILREDWYCSFIGKSAVSNLIYIELFEKHMQNIPFQKFGFYLCENIAWEKALIAAWKNNNHGNLVAVQHSTVRFWDLRYFSHPKIHIGEGFYNQPSPDFYALNGEVAWNYFINNGYLKSKLLKAEALRYQFLEKYTFKSDFGSVLRRDLNNKKVLILGDFTEKQTYLMLDSLVHIFHKYTCLHNYTIKPHPVSKINISKYSNIGLKQNDGQLQDILKNFDLVFSSNCTSAGVDCMYMGAEVIIFMDSDDLNHNPLRDLDGINFVRDSDELYSALSLGINLKQPINNNSFFWLNSDMVKWKVIIENLSN